MTSESAVGSTNTLGALWARTRSFRPVLVLLIAMVVLFTVLQGAFATSDNIKSMLSNTAVLWMVAMGMTFVLLSGGFDLSVGATAALSGIFMAKVLTLGLPGGMALFLVLVLGALVGGVINGILVARFQLSVFVVTLAAMIGLSGAVELWAQTKSFYVTAPIANTLGVSSLLGIPVPIWLMAAVFLVALYAQSMTYFGRDVYAIGGSPVAARLAGIRVPRTLIMVYAISGTCAALGGAIAVGRVGAAVPQVDGTLPLEAIAAVLLGGTALSGGRGGVGGTALGVLFVAVLANGLSLSGVSSDWQSVVTAVILIVAVLGDRMRFGAVLGRGSRASAPTITSPAVAPR